MPSRTFEAETAYRYGFNGKEKDLDAYSTSVYDYGFRIYNPAIGKFLSVDPLTKDFSMLTPYQFASNKPISGIDLDGLEFKLAIYDPVMVVDFINTYNSGDIYKARKIAYDAINSTFSQEELEKYIKSYGTKTISKNTQGQTKKGDLTYNKENLDGLTVEMTFPEKTESGLTILKDMSFHWERNTNGQADKNYPVDVKVINSNEYDNFYGSYDFVGRFSEPSVSFVLAHQTGWIDGNIKGYGFVTYSFEGTGVSTTPFAGKSMGMLTGNFNLDNTKEVSPSVLEGYGASLTVGAGFASTGTWYSFANKTDMLNMNTNKATISGKIEGWSFGLSKFKSSITTSFTITTLDKPKGNGKIETNTEVGTY